MKKILFSALIISVILSAAACSKNDSPAAASPAATQTPANTTPTATPVINISAFVNGVNSTKSYWITVNVNSASYQYATVTVNSDTLVYNGTSAYVESGATTPYTAGIVYSILIKTEYGNFTCERTGPGGNIAVTGSTATYQYDGNSDFVLVTNGTSTTYNSALTIPDIDSGFVIPESSAFPAPGNYYVSVYPYYVEANAFTGPVTPNSGDIMIEDLKMISVTK